MQWEQKLAFVQLLDDLPKLLSKIGIRLAEILDYNFTRNVSNIWARYEPKIFLFQFNIFAFTNNMSKWTFSYFTIFVTSSRFVNYLFKFRNMIIQTENSWYFIFFVRTSNVFWQDESNFKNEIRRSLKQEKVPENHIVKPTHLKIQKSDQGNDDISFSKNFFFMLFYPVNVALGV